MLDASLKEACEKVLGKWKNSKQPSWVSQQTLKLLEKQGKAKAKYTLSQLASDKQAWHNLQNQVLTAYDHDHTLFHEAPLKILEEAYN